jgi:hypothetical protein
VKDGEVKKDKFARFEAQGEAGRFRFSGWNHVLSIFGKFPMIEICREERRYIFGKEGF